MPWQTLNTPVDVCHRDILWHLVIVVFIHYRKSVTSNTFRFRNDSESQSAINKTFCGHRLHWFKKIKSDLLFSNAEWNNREQEKSKYLDNISVLPTSIFIFDKFVDGSQPEVADEIAGRRHILRTLLVSIVCNKKGPIPVDLDAKVWKWADSNISCYVYCKSLTGPSSIHCELLSAHTEH